MTNSSKSFYHSLHPCILKVSGADSLRYLNARLSNDFRQLATGDTVLAGMLTAQAKTEALFIVQRLDEAYLLIAHSGNPEQTIQAFRKFIVADRVTVESLSDNHELLQIYNSDEDANLILRQASYSLKTKTSQYLVIPKSGFTATCNELKQAAYNELTAESYNFIRLLNKEYCYPYELNEQQHFLEGGLTSAYSRSKGCYIGQEAMEMLESRGKTPARVFTALLMELPASKFQLGQTANLKSENFQEDTKVLAMGFDKESQQTILSLRVKNWQQLELDLRNSEMLIYLAEQVVQLG